MQRRALRLAAAAHAVAAVQDVSFAQTTVDVRVVARTGDLSGVPFSPTQDAVFREFSTPVLDALGRVFFGAEIGLTTGRDARLQSIFTDDFGTITPIAVAGQGVFDAASPPNAVLLVGGLEDGWKANAAGDVLMPGNFSAGGGVAARRLADGTVDIVLPTSALPGPPAPPNYFVIGARLANDATAVIAANDPGLTDGRVWQVAATGLQLIAQFGDAAPIPGAPPLTGFHTDFVIAPTTNQAPGPAGFGLATGGEDRFAFWGSTAFAEGGYISFDGASLIGAGFNATDICDPALVTTNGLRGTFDNSRAGGKFAPAGSVTVNKNNRVAFATGSRTTQGVIGREAIFVGTPGVPFDPAAMSPCTAPASSSTEVFGSII